MILVGEVLFLMLARVIPSKCNGIYLGENEVEAKEEIGGYLSVRRVTSCDWISFTLCHCIAFLIPISRVFDEQFANSLQPINSFDQLASIDRSV